MKTIADQLREIELLNQPASSIESYTTHGIADWRIYDNLDLLLGKRKLKRRPKDAPCEDWEPDRTKPCDECGGCR